VNYLIIYYDTLKAKQWWLSLFAKSKTMVAVPVCDVTGALSPGGTYYYQVSAYE